MLVEPIDEAVRPVIGQPIRPPGRLDDVTGYAPVRGVLRIVVAQHLDLVRAPLVKTAVRVGQRHGRPCVRKPDGLVQHVGSQQAPGKFPRVAPDHVVERLDVVGKLGVPPRLRLAANPPQRRTVDEVVEFGRGPFVRPPQDPQVLQPVILGRVRIKEHHAEIGVSGHRGELSRHPVLVRDVMAEAQRDAFVQIAATGDRPEHVSHGVRPAGDVRKFHDPVAHLFRGVWRRERIRLGREIRRLRVARRVGAQIDAREFRVRHFLDGLPTLTRSAIFLDVGLGRIDRGRRRRREHEEEESRGKKGTVSSHRLSLREDFRHRAVVPRLAIGLRTRS